MTGPSLPEPAPDDSIANDHSDAHARLPDVPQNVRYEAIRTKVTKPDVIWSYAKQGKLRNHVTPNAAKRICSQGVRTNYENGMLSLEIELLSTSVSSFEPDDQQRRDFFSRIEQSVNPDTEIEVHWQDRRLSLLYGDQIATITWPKPKEEGSGQVFRYETNIEVVHGPEIFEQALQGGLAIFREYVGNAYAMAEQELPDGMFHVAPPVTGSELVTRPESHPLVVRERPELNSERSEIGKVMVVARPKFQLLDIPDMSREVESFLPYANNFSSRDLLDPLRATEREIFLVEGAFSEKRERLIEGFAGSASAKVLYVHEAIATNNRGKLVERFRRQYCKFLKERYGEAESTRTVFVITAPPVGLFEKGEDPPLSEISADDLYRALDVERGWDDTVVVFNVLSAEEISPDILERVTLRLSTDPKEYPWSMEQRELAKSLEAQVVELEKRAGGLIQLEDLDFAAVFFGLWDDGCQTYSDLSDTVSYAITFARDRDLFRTDDQPITLTADHIRYSWERIRQRRSS